MNEEKEGIREGRKLTAEDAEENQERKNMRGIKCLPAAKVTTDARI